MSIFQRIHYWRTPTPINKATLDQIEYWSTALTQANKGARRKNKHINRLIRENQHLKEEMSKLKYNIAKLTYLET